MVAGTTVPPCAIREERKRVNFSKSNTSERGNPWTAITLPNLPAQSVLEEGMQLNTSTATFFKLDWLNASGICYVCDQCGFIHWFLPK